MTNDPAPESHVDLPDFERPDRLMSSVMSMAQEAVDRVEVLLAENRRLREEVAGLKVELEGATHNRFYDQRDAYFEGLDEGRSV